MQRIHRFLAKRPGARDALLAIALLGTFFVLAVSSLPFLSVTTDEPHHYQYGMKILNSDAGRSNPSTMPVSALNAFPAWLGDRLPESRLARGLRHFQVARLPTLAAAIALGALLFGWSRSMYGRRAGFLSLFLFVFDPNILAHARLITTDVFLALAILICLHSFSRFAQRRTFGRALVAALAAGVAQVTKYTAVGLAPILMLLILVYDLPRLRAAIRRGRWRQLGRYLAGSVLLLALFVGVTIAMVNLAFLREYTLRPLREYTFASAFFRDIQSWTSRAPWVKVPIPYWYMQGLDAVMRRERTRANIYLLGEIRHGQGFSGYFLAASALKVPLATQGIFLLSVIALARSGSWRRFVRQEQFLVLPLVVFGSYFNFVFRNQIGLRFVLMLFPLMHILSGRLVQHWPAWSNGKRIALGIGLASITLSTLSYHPDYLAYFNEIVWDRRLAFRYLADSNLDWGQSETFLNAYLADHPEAMLEPQEITQGEVIVRVNNLVGITEDPRRYAMLREDCTPIATIGHAYLLYRVPCTEGGGLPPD